MRGLIILPALSLSIVFSIFKWLKQPFPVESPLNDNVNTYRAISEKEKFTTRQPTQERCAPESQKEEEASIIILSCLTPSAPDIRMIEMVYASLTMLEGLSQTAPVIIAIDNLVEEGGYWNVKQNYFASTVENRERLESYIRNLRLRFKDDKRVTILPFVMWQMHNHAIKGALEMVDTKFVYILQHDEYFTKSVNHTAIVKTMEEYPDVLRKVVFNRDPNIMACEHYWFRGNCSCKEDAVSDVNGVEFTKTTGWTDVCHLTTKQYYNEVIEILGDRKVHPESVMNRASTKYNCTYWGDHFYGNATGGPFVHHVHGRFTSNSSLTGKIARR